MSTYLGDIDPDAEEETVGFHLDQEAADLLVPNQHVVRPLEADLVGARLR